MAAVEVVEVVRVVVAAVEAVGAAVVTAAPRRYLAPAWPTASRAHGP